MPKVSSTARMPRADEIKKLRNEAGWTQEQAAKRVRSGSLSSYQRWEQGTHPMPEAAFELMLLKVRLAKDAPAVLQKAETEFDTLVGEGHQRGAFRASTG